MVKNYFLITYNIDQWGFFKISLLKKIETQVKMVYTQLCLHYTDDNIAVESEKFL